MSIARTWAVTLRIVRQFRRDPRTLILVFAVPIVVILLVGYLLRTTSGGIKLGFVDETGGAAAPALQALGQSLSEAGVTPHYLSRAEAEKQVKGDKLDGAIIIAPTAQGQGVSVLLEGSNPQRSKAILRIAQQASLAVSTASALPPASARGRASCPSPTTTAGRASRPSTSRRRPSSASSPSSSSSSSPPSASCESAPPAPWNA